MYGFVFSSSFFLNRNVKEKPDRCSIDFPVEDQGHLNGNLIDQSSIEIQLLCCNHIKMIFSFELLIELEINY